MPRSVTPLPASPETTSESSPASPAEAAGCPGDRRNTVQSVYSVSPDAGVVTASGYGADEGEVGAVLEDSVPVALDVMSQSSSVRISDSASSLRRRAASCRAWATTAARPVPATD